MEPLKDRNCLHFLCVFHYLEHCRRTNKWVSGIWESHTRFWGRAASATIQKTPHNPIAFPKKRKYRTHLHVRSPHWQSMEMNNLGKLLLWDAHSQSTWESGCSRIPQSPYVAPIKGVPFCYSWETPSLEPRVLQGHPWPSEQIQSINHRKKTCSKSSALERWRCMDSNTVWIFKKRNKMSKSTEV